MRLFTWLAVTGVAFSAAAAACTYPSFHFRGEDGGGGTGVGGTPNGGNGLGGTDTGVAGSGATPTGTGGGTGGGGDGGSGGQPPTPCTAYSTGECAGGMKCSVWDVDAGTWGCVEAGPRPPWTYCQHDVECQEGLWCDLASQVCKPICQNGNACPVGGNCLAAAGNGADIPGLQICTAYCDPLDPQSCNQAFGTTNCVHASNTFDCSAGGNGGEFAPCDTHLDCGPGLLCLGVLWDAVCGRWCRVGVDQCGFLTNCESLDPQLFYEAIEVGVCF